MRHPDPASEPDPKTRRAVAELARAWLKLVVSTTFVPGPRAAAQARLEELVWRLVAALRDEPTDPECGRRVGADLVDARMSSPAVLGESLTLLSHELPAVVRGAGPDFPLRLSALLGQVATGFTTALRDAAVEAAESINRAERAAWRRKQLALHRRLQNALLHEPLTGLPNRAKLMDWLADQLMETDGHQRLGICLLNLDRFAAVNDSLGHDTGDQLLLQVARNLRPVALQHDYFLAHLGADEFVLAVPDTRGTDDVLKTAEQMLRALPNPFLINGHQLPVTAKTGIAESAHAHAEPTELLRAAHVAVGWAKTEGRGAVAIFDAQRSDADIRRHRLTAAMPAAVDNGEFVLDFQPLVRLADGRVVGFEALARWHHPTLGVLGPGQFIPLAEQTGLIEPLGLHLLEQACFQAAAWLGQDSRPLVSVNLAPTQLAHPGLVAGVSAVLDHTRLPPRQLQLEITESAVLDAHQDTLHQLADLGVRLAIDDFGTGYSSLAYLADLPILTVKLAAQFLSRVDRPPNGTRRRGTATLLPNVITMCHDLEISVTAEGIETADQAAHLYRLGCDIGQGFHLARPASAEAATNLLHHTFPIAQPK